MAAVNRFYSSNAMRTTITASITSTATSIVVGVTTGFPGSVPFTLVLDEGQVLEEIVTVTAVAGTTLTVVRGVDGTTGVAHSTGANVVHAMTARDLREPQEHIAAITGVHGITGALSGAADLSAHTTLLTGAHGLAYSSGTWDGGGGFGGPGASYASESGVWSITNGWLNASGTFEFLNVANGGYSRNMVTLLPFAPRVTAGTGPNADGGNASASGYKRMIGTFRYMRADDTQSVYATGHILATFSYGWIGVLYSGLAPLVRTPIAGEAMQISLSYPV